MLSQSLEQCEWYMVPKLLFWIPFISILGSKNSIAWQSTTGWRRVRLNVRKPEYSTLWKFLKQNRRKKRFLYPEEGAISSVSSKFISNSPRFEERCWRLNENIFVTEIIRSLQTKARAQKRGLCIFLGRRLITDSLRREKKKEIKQRFDNRSDKVESEK